jgi:hypothetical protein
MPVIDNHKLALSMNVYLAPKEMLADIYNISNVVQPAATFTAVARVGVATVLWVCNFASVLWLHAQE